MASAVKLARFSKSIDEPASAAVRAVAEAAPAAAAAAALVHKEPSRITTKTHVCDAPLVCHASITNQDQYAQSDFVRQAARRLSERGAVAMDIEGQCTHGGQQTSREFVRMLNDSKLFRHKADKPSHTPEDLRLIFTGGSFGGLAVPELDHHETTRRWREYAHALCVPVLGRFLEQSGLAEQGYVLAQYPDRLLWRNAGVEPSAESWHRDLSPFVHDGDLVLGGWLNTDTHDQYLSFIACSHLEAAGSGKVMTRRANSVGASALSVYGYARAEGDTMTEAQRMVAADATRAARVRIPPGGILLFFENCLHEVLKAKFDHPVQRLFVCFHLTRSGHTLLGAKLTAPQRSLVAAMPAMKFMGHGRANQVLNSYDTIIEMMHRQAVLPLKSGQTPLMYPHRWLMPNGLRYLLIMSAGVTASTPALQDALFEWRDTTDKQRTAIQRAVTPIVEGGFFDSELVRALVVLNARGDLPGATREAMLPPRIRVVRQVLPALADLPIEFRRTPYTTEHLHMFDQPRTTWRGLSSPWSSGEAHIAVALYPVAAASSLNNA